MACDWQLLQPGEVAVAHISDLHFGRSTRAEEVWPEVAEFITSTVRPELVIVTGDLVDSPNDKNYTDAKGALDSLGLPYLVCSGNHDRYKKGNKVSALLSESIVTTPLWILRICALALGAIGRFLVPDPLPARLLFAEPLRRRMRVKFGGVWIADSEDVILLHEPGR